MEEFFTIEGNVSSEIVEKKSRFIGNLFYVDNKFDAEEKIREIKKKYHDAKHNCFAYRVIENEKVIEKCSDDGEPSGTAGAPILNIIKNNSLCNVLIVITRYFGGILLGTGGLVRAYSDTTIKTIKQGIKVCKCKGFLARIELDYNNLDIFKYYCKNNNIRIINIEYLDIVVCKIELENTIKEKILKDINTKKINIKDIKILCKNYINKSVEK